MAQRTSEYERKERDLYETPEWVTEALIPHICDLTKYSPVIGTRKKVWEPACASGRMSKVLAKYFDVYSSDIVTDYGDNNLDFLTTTQLKIQNEQIDGIITNPPFGKLGANFMRHAIHLFGSRGGFVAMLAPHTFDCATQRADLFGPGSGFACKLVLTKRIVWFEPEPGEDIKAAPSSNHAWFIWDLEHRNREPVTRYFYP